MKTFLMLALAIFLFSCGQQTKQNTDKDIPHPTIYVTPAGDKIIFLEDYYGSYLKAIKNDYANRNQLYERIVQDTIFADYFAKSDYSELVKSKLSSPIRDTTGLRKYVADITSNRSKIEDLITSTLTESRKYLKDDSLTIYVLPCDADVEKVIKGKRGVEGMAAGSKQILITINSEINEWMEMLPYTIAREFDQAYWTKMNFNKAYQPTLLDYLVSEGRADSYAHLIYPNTLATWTKVMPKEVELEVWNKIKSQLKNTDVAYQYNVMFGSKSEYVLWGGFTLGYHIVQSALKNHPELTPVEWVSLPPQKILEMSDYK